MQEMSPVSIIVPTLNEEKYLPILLESISKIKYPLEVIVVDGGSTDKTLVVAETAKKFFADAEIVRIIPFGKRGVSRQRNVGASYAVYDTLLFCDADIIAPTTQEFQFVVSECIKRELVVASCRIIPLEKNYMDSCTHTIAFGFQRLMLWLGKSYFAGGFLLTKKDVFISLGGFDENLRVSEDVDYSLRAAKKGKTALFNIPIKASTRRFKKYGYGWIVKNPAMLYKLVVRGKLTKKDKVFYPFGEY